MKTIFTSNHNERPIVSSSLSFFQLHGSLGPNDPSSFTSSLASFLLNALESETAVAGKAASGKAAAAAAAAGSVASSKAAAGAASSGAAAGKAAAAAATAGIPSLPLLIAPAAAWLAGQEAVRRRETLRDDQEQAERDLKQIQDSLQTADSAIAVRGTIYICICASVYIYIYTNKKHWRSRSCVYREEDVSTQLPVDFHLCVCVCVCVVRVCECASVCVSICMCICVSTLEEGKCTIYSPT